MGKYKRESYDLVLQTRDEGELKKATRKLVWETDYILIEENDEQGVSQLHGCIRFKHPRSLSSVRKLLGPLWMVKQSETEWESKLGYYLRIQGKRHTNIPKAFLCRGPPTSRIDQPDLQTDLMGFVAMEPDQTIKWVYEKVPCIGKTSLIRHIWSKYSGTLYMKEHAAHIVTMMSDVAALKKPRICIFDALHSDKTRFEYQKFGDLVKGVLAIRKGKTVRIDPPRVIVFANFEPDFEKITSKGVDISTIEEHSEYWGMLQ